ncbi:hypothetical protein MY4824_001463 [Beauveria thailandica]
MCGFVASCVCSVAEDNSDIHGHVIGKTQRRLQEKKRTNGYGNGITGLADGTKTHTSGVNGHSNGTNGTSSHRGISNGHKINGHFDGFFDGYFRGHIKGYLNGQSGHISDDRLGDEWTHVVKPATNGEALQALEAINGAKETAGIAAREGLAKQIQAGVDAIKHRGPDGSGVWISPDARVGLGHCRLSINDLSPSGDQPLHSDDGHIHAVVNGEIYDHDRLRQVCIKEHGYKFTGNSDSELVIALYKIHGAPSFLEHLRGEFAFVLYDELLKKVIAGRDRFGIKPLVWTVIGNRVVFSAEAKAFLPLGWKPEWNVRGITDSGWMMDDRTVFKGVRKLMPGHWMEVTEERGVEIHKYWDAEYPDKTKPDPRSIEEMVAGVRERLVEAIRLRLRADVPVGIYLSGGIDSSTVAGIVTDLARKQHVKIGSEQATRVACFSVRFPQESGYDESEKFDILNKDEILDIADRTAEFLGVQIHKIDVDEQRMADDFSDAAYHCEHHHFDLNTVAKFALSTLPRQHGIKVVLTGEGSDEHFSGYPYFPAEFLRARDGGMPDAILSRNDELREELQKSASAEMNAVWRSQGAAEYEGASDSPLLADANGNTMPESLLAWHPANSLFREWVQDQYQGRWDMRDTVMAGHSDEVRAKMRDRWHPAHTAMYMWNKSTLINVILSCLGDRTEMAHSIEARTPFLDHRLAEYVNSLPPSTKLNYMPPSDADGEDKVDNFWWKSAGKALRQISEKWILREAARPYITDELYHRRKLPFLAPARWPADGPLHNMFRKLLTREAVENLGFVNYDVVQQALGDAFGENAKSTAFRILAYTGGWVTLSQRFGVKKATVTENGWR